MEKKANDLYDKYLKKSNKLVGTKTTYLTQLDKVGRKLFGTKFRGVYPSDRIPKLTDSTPYAILNLDKESGIGTHWISVCKIPGKNETMIYDSFGRHHKKIISTLNLSGNGKIINTKLDAEQRLFATDCGSRSICWIMLFDKHGPDVAKLI